MSSLRFYPYPLLAAWVGSPVRGRTLAWRSGSLGGPPDGPRRRGRGADDVTAHQGQEEAVRRLGRDRQARRLRAAAVAVYSDMPPRCWGPPLGMWTMGLLLGHVLLALCSNSSGPFTHPCHGGNQSSCSGSCQGKSPPAPDMVIYCWCTSWGPLDPSWEVLEVG